MFKDRKSKLYYGSQFTNNFLIPSLIKSKNMLKHKDIFFKKIGPFPLRYGQDHIDCGISHFPIPIGKPLPKLDKITLI